MPAPGTISHIDFSAGDSTKSITFYDTLLTTLGFVRMVTQHPGFSGPNPQRAWWSINYPDGGRFGIEVRPAHEQGRTRRYNRYEPGPHHIAFHAQDQNMVNRCHAALTKIDAEVLDPPCDYSGQQGYSEGYYAAFFADPDGVKLEVVHLPQT